MKAIVILLMLLAIVPGFCVITPYLCLQEGLYSDSLLISDTRCVLLDVGYEDISEAITDMKIVDISNPENPQTGYEYHIENWNSGFVYPTLKDTLLFYATTTSANYTFRIDNISDINNPQNLFTITVPQCYAFSVHGNYMLMGMQNGDIQVYDFNDLNNVHLANTTNVMPSIWRIYDLGDSIAVSCGNWLNPTVKILSVNEQTLALEEIYTITPPWKDKHIGVFSNKLAIRGENGHTYIYGVENDVLSLWNDIAYTAGWRSAITDGELIFASDGLSLIRALQYNDDSHSLEQLGSYQFRDTYQLRHRLVATHDRTLVCVTNYNTIYWLDTSNPIPDNDVISHFSYDYPIQHITYMENPGGHIYANAYNQNLLLDVEADNSLSLNTVLENEPYMFNYQAYGHCLYGTGENALGYPVIKVLDCSVPSQPYVYQETYCESRDFFSQKGNVIYAGYRNQPIRYRIEPQGFLSFEDSLGYYFFYPDINPNWIYFNDITEADGRVYAVAQSSDYEYSDTQHLIYDKYNGYTHCFLEPEAGKFIHKYADHLFTLGEYFSVYDLDYGSYPDLLQADNLLYTSGRPSECLPYANYLIVSFDWFNKIVIYDLTNPTQPSIARTIQQNCSPVDMCLVDNMLYVANGAYGIAAYDLSDLTPIEDEVVIPAISTIHAFPNPFSDKISIAFELKQPESVNLKIYNIKGQLVRTIKSSKLEAGKNQLQWDGRDASGKSCAGGIYFSGITARDKTAMKKIIKLK